jgi:hypothetical protein
MADNSERATEANVASDPELVIEGLRQYAREEILRDYRPDSCLESCRIGQMVLKEFGIASSPCSARVMAANPELAKYVETHNKLPATPEEMDSFGGWLVQCGHTGEKEIDKWDGHLVLLTRVGEQTYLIDLSIDQASRPHKNMILEPVAHLCSLEFRTRNKMAIDNAAGCHLEYELFPADKSFLGATGWSRIYNKPKIAELIVFRIKRFLNRKERA